MYFDPDSSKQKQRAQEKQARQRQEEITRLRGMWKKYNFPTQERMDYLLKECGLKAARIATEALEKSHEKI